MDMQMMKSLLARHWLKNRIITDKRVVDSFKKVPRECFVMKGWDDEAYLDYPLPIMEGQTISQPSTIMLMTQLLDLKKGNKVLEVGAGSGYHAAIIANIIFPGIVYSAEISRTLAAFAGKNLKRCRIRNVSVLNIDGSRGYEKEAPYDRIIVTAGCPEIPEPLAEQLKEGGVIVAPVGGADVQVMVKGIRKMGVVEYRKHGSFVFVPLKGKYGY